ncbi:hypothetical protein B0H10DRAFT_796250 [Mycena sp. CBHHK59/15]|nr:hypothetical protein B0H10DRAFT_796250 [Mycena sp. CBHHK59/15]
MLLAAFSTLVLVGVTAGQSTNATCSSNFDWTFNSLEQSPCLVAAYLGSVCNNVFMVPALVNDMSYYQGPTVAQANSCGCSSVFIPYWVLISFTIVGQHSTRTVPPSIPSYLLAIFPPALQSPTGLTRTSRCITDSILLLRRLNSMHLNPLPIRKPPVLPYHPPQKKRMQEPLPAESSEDSFF